MNDDNLDLLDLDDSASMDALPDAAPFAAPRPKKPWLLLTVGLIVIILATYVIIRAIGSDSSSSIDIDLDAPAVVVDSVDAPVVAPSVAGVPATENTAPVVVAPQQQPVVTPAAPVAQPQRVTAPTAGVPQREVQDRKEVTFNPDKPAAEKPVVKPAAKKAPAKSAVKKTVKKTQAAPKSAWYVQFGSYSTRALAENAERQIRAGHSNLFAGKQFVILAAQLPNGTTTYRLRIGFATSNEANGFCRNAKSDGVDCYVAK